MAKKNLNRQNREPKPKLTMAVRKKIDWKTVVIAAVVAVAAVFFLGGITIKSWWAAVQAKMKTS